MVWCADCTENVQQVQREWNEIRTEGSAGWALCQGCGLHWFDVDGDRLCWPGRVWDDALGAWQWPGPPPEIPPDGAMCLLCATAVPDAARSV